MLSIDEPVQANGRELRRKIQTYRFTLHHWHNQSNQEIILPPIQQAYYEAQAMKNDEFLCVASRCHRQEKNALVFNHDGVLQRSWHVGDGVEDVQVAPNGAIWVSYFDEGVFGDTPISNQGLNCFDSEGNRKFGFLNDTTGAAVEIVDCYALNVASNRDTWLLFYTGFPLVHLREQKVHAIYQATPEMIGCHAFAICDSRRLFTGGYHFKNRIFWRDEASKRQVELEVTDQNGDELSWNHACGRGGDLFLCNGPKVWMLSLNEIGF
ncbi:MAG TPA: hypothetical protein VF627_09565 [Abditibacterium sp.]